MSSTSRLPISQGQSSAQDLTLVTSAIARLRAEHDGTGESASRAILLHEIGVLEERLGDEAASARDQLGAVNAEPDFREPLERLIAIIERRQSYKNLGKLLERLVRVAERPEERSRALLDQAFYLLDHEDDFGNARSLLEQATDETPRDASVWLALELVAGKLGDSELRERALLARAALTANPLWKALLLLSLAEQRAAADEAEGAERALEEAAAIESPARFSALSALADLALKNRLWAVGVRAHARIAEAILETLADPARADAIGVPPHRRSSPQAADAWLCAAEMARETGDTALSIELLERGLETLPSDPMLLRARFHAADTLGDTATAARLAQSELDRGATGPGAASLFLRVAEARASENDAVGALAAVGRALTEDAASIAARALLLDLLGMGDDAQAFASALEAAAEQFPSDDAKARLYLLSADVWARQCKDAQGARAALSQAGMFGAAPAVVARVARLLASLGEDAAWYEEATRRLIAQGATEAEQAGLWFELSRARGLRGERAATGQALNGLAAAPGGAWLGNALTAYALDLLPLRPGEERPAQATESDATGPALSALAAQESDAATAHALRMMGVLRAALRGDHAAARKELEELHTADPADVLVARALSTLEKAHASPEHAADVLAATASATTDPELGLALELEAGILSWQAGDRKAAVESFGAASRSEEHTSELQSRS